MLIERMVAVLGRVYKGLFHGGFYSLLTLPFTIFSTLVNILNSCDIDINLNSMFRESLLSDCGKGCFVVACTLCTFISLVWLREQILQGGGPEWLAPVQPPQQVVQADAQQVDEGGRAEEENVHARDVDEAEEVEEDGEEEEEDEDEDEEEENDAVGEDGEGVVEGEENGEIDANENEVEGEQAAPRGQYGSVNDGKCSVLLVDWLLRFMDTRSRFSKCWGIVLGPVL